jgi:hypothetical protein
LRQEENPLVLWSQLAPGPSTTVLRKTNFLTSESTLSLLQQSLLLQSVVRLGNAHPDHTAFGGVGNLDLSVQETSYSVGGADLGSPNVLITAENRHLFRLLEPV